MQEHVPADKLARVYSYDMVGSFVAIPVGQVAAGPIAEAVGVPGDAGRRGRADHARRARHAEPAATSVTCDTELPERRVAARGRIGRVTVPNVLAARYASAELVALWSPEEKIRMERRLWLAVLRAQRDLGVAVPDGVVEAYERVLDDVDLASIAARERVTRHDVKARIEEFSALAGHEHDPQGHDLARPHRERRAAADPGLAGADPRPGGRRAGPARRARASSTPTWSWPAARTTSRRRPPRWASGSRRRPRSC